MILVINIISLSRLIEGGAAILNTENKNQNLVIIGKKLRIPFTINVLRVFVVVYVV